MRWIKTCAALSALTVGWVAVGWPQGVASVDVTPSEQEMAVGEKKAFQATARNSRGGVNLTADISWRSSDESVITVEWNPAAPALATVTAVGSGEATLEATAGGRTGRAAITVSGGGVMPQVLEEGTGVATALSAEPGALRLLPTEEIQIVLRFQKDDGSAAASQPVTFESLNPGVATVSEAGVVTAVGEGQGSIRISTPSGLSRLVPVQILDTGFDFARPAISLSPGTIDSVEVVVPEQESRRVNPGLLQWSSSNPSVVTVSPRGLLSASRPGRAQITATLGFQSQQLPVTVHREVEGIFVEPSQGLVQVPLGGGVPMEVEAVASDDTPISEAVISWFVEDESVAGFEPDPQGSQRGQLIGKELGSTTLRAVAPGPGLEAVWDVEVIAGGLALVPAGLGLGVGEEESVRVMLTDQDGNALAEARGISWSSGDPAVARVSEDGTVTATGMGRTDITITTSWGSTETLPVFVQPVLLITSSRNGSWDLFAVDPASPQQAVQITSDPGREYAGSYSPDGSKIVYIASSDGNQDIFVANADGSDPIRLTESAGQEGRPSWTPDGNQILFQSDVEGRQQIWIMNADGSNPRQLTEGPGINFQPALSPDGQTVAFVSIREGYDVYLMNIDGSNQRNITNNPTRESWPVWFPDGSLSFLMESGGDGVIVRANLMSGETVQISPSGLSVVEYDVSSGGETVAMVVAELSGGGVSRQLHLLAVGAGAAATTRVPPSTPDEQMFSPSYRH